MLGWSTYILAAQRSLHNNDIEEAYSILPSLCPRNEYKVHVDEFDVDVHIVEFPVRRVIKDIYMYSDYTSIADFVLSRAKDQTIFHMHNLFALSFMYELHILLKRLKKLRNNIKIVVQQHSNPPYKRFHEAHNGLKGVAIGLLGEGLFRVNKAYIRYIDGYIVMNKKTYAYLTRELGIPDSRVIYQHVGVDYEKIKPEVYTECDTKSIWNDCSYKLVLVSHITRKYGGYVKGIDFIPIVARLLRKYGYKTCIAVLGEIMDTTLAQKLRESPGVKLLGFLPHTEALKVISSADLYILPARKQCYYGGIGVSIIEALALNIPVVSPTLEHVPDSKAIRHLGIRTEWVNRTNLGKFVKSVITALDNKTTFSPRQYSRKFYDIRIMVQNIEKLYKAVLDDKN